MPLDYYRDPDEDKAIALAAVRDGRPNLHHGAYSAAAMGEAAANVRAQLRREYPGIEEMSLPTVELYCSARGRALALSEWVMGVVNGEIETQTNRRGVPRTGWEAVPERILKALAAAEHQAARLAQDLGLDLTGRAKVLKDAAMSRHFGQDQVASLAQEGQRLRELRASG